MKHHPKTETLAAFAAGAFEEARSVVLNAHLDLCPDCRAIVRDFEALGGALLEAAAPAPFSEGALASFWSRAGEQIEFRRANSKAEGLSEDIADIFALKRYLPKGFAGAEWRPLVSGVSQAVLSARGYREGALRLLKIEPGTRIPKHTHGDCEFTLILSGAYDDELGSFARGDFADLDEEDTHSPMAVGDRPCICLIATNAALSFREISGKIVQPFVGL
jgi:putative transcriptional regulator